MRQTYGKGVTYLPDHLHQSDDLARVSGHIRRCRSSDRCKWSGKQVTRQIIGQTFILWFKVFYIIGPFFLFYSWVTLIIVNLNVNLLHHLTYKQMRLFSFMQRLICWKLFQWSSHVYFYGLSFPQLVYWVPAIFFTDVCTLFSPQFVCGLIPFFLSVVSTGCLQFLWHA